MGPLAGLLMSKLPRRVSFTTSDADAMQIMASHSMRRACNTSSTGKKWSSRNNMPAITMSALARSLRQRARAAALLAYSDAACREMVSCGSSRARRRRARSTLLARCVSMVTMTKFSAIALRGSAAEVGFCIVKCLHGDVLNPHFGREAFGIATGFSAHKERNFS